MFHKLKSIAPLPGKILLAEFQDGTVKTYDTKPLKAKLPVFAMLDYVHGLFEQVRIDAGGMGVVWNDDLDLAAEEIYYNGVTQQ